MTTYSPVSPEKLVAFLKAVVEQHVNALQSHLGIVYSLCLLLYVLLLPLLLGTRHCLECRVDPKRWRTHCDPGVNLKQTRIGLLPLRDQRVWNRDASLLGNKKHKK